MAQKQSRALFREHALQQYMHKSENDLLPSIVSPPVFLLVWIFLSLVIISGLFAWMERIPVFTNSSGGIKVSEQQLNAHENTVHIVVFVPRSIGTQVRVGMRAKAQFDTSSQYFDGTISAINPLVLSPVAIRKHYQLSCNMLPTMLDPAMSATMIVVVPSSMVVENGALSQVQIQTGSQRILDLLPFFQQLTGDS